MSSSNIPFSCWLAVYLGQLNRDIDVEIYANYIEGLLKDGSMDDHDTIDSIRCFLESILPSKSAIDCSEAIFARFHNSESSTCSVQNSSTVEVAAITAKHLDGLEEQMRSLVTSTIFGNEIRAPPSPSCLPLKSALKNKNKGKAGKQRFKKHDPCTIAALRDAGVEGYQGGEKAELELSISLANAEYFAKQSAAGLVPSASLGKAVSKSGKAGSKVDDLASATVALVEGEEPIFLEEVEASQGYGKKEGIKPGCILDALSTLNPNQFASPTVALTVAENVKSTNQIKRLPTPGDINSSTTPGYLLLNSRSAGCMGTAASTSSSTNLSTAASANRKKQTPSKHLASIGTRAEQRRQRLITRKQEKLKAFGINGAGSNRLDDLDAFLLSDDDGDDDEGEEEKNDKINKEDDDAAAAADVSSTSDGDAKDVKFVKPNRQQRANEALDEANTHPARSEVVRMSP